MILGFDPNLGSVFINDERHLKTCGNGSDCCNLVNVSNEATASAEYVLVFLTLDHTREVRQAPEQREKYNARDPVPFAPHSDYSGY